MTYLLIDPLVDAVSLIEEFVECQCIEQSLFAHLGQLKQLLVATVNGAKTTEHLRVLTVLHTHWCH